MSKVFLVSANCAEEPYAVYPLGLSVIAAALSRAGHEVTQYDFLSSGKSESALRDALRACRPDFVGLSVRNVDSVDSSTGDDAFYLATDRRVVEITRQTTDAALIVGGPGYSLMPREILDYLGADYGVVGEGERAVCELIGSILEGRSVQSIVSSDCPVGGLEVETGWQRAMIDYYGSRSLMGIQTKRGCEFNCLYCSYSAVDGPRLRCRQAGAVVDELELLSRSFGVNQVFFADSVFNDTAGHYLSVAEEVIRRNTPVSWSAFFRPERISRETLRLLKRGGLKSIEIGTDASSDETLSAIRKPFTFDDVIAFQDACSVESIPCCHYVMFGCPGENEATLKKGLENIAKLEGCVVLGFAGLRIFPNTGLHEMAVRDGVISKDSILLKPTFYFSPEIEQSRLDRMIKEAFSGRRDRIYPPSQAKVKRDALNRMGIYGPLWEKLIRF